MKRDLLCFFCTGCTHFISLSFTIWQELRMPWISQLHLPPQKNPCLLRPVAVVLNIIIIVPFSRLRAKAPLTHMDLHHVIGSFSQVTSEDRHNGDTTVHVLIQFRGAYWRYWKNCPHLLFVSQQDESSCHLCTEIANGGRFCRGSFSCQLGRLYIRKVEK
jgi:hypothetical protein